MELKDRIKKIRKDNHLTQAEFGNMLHVSSQVVSNWERGYTNVNGHDLQNIAKTFEINPIVLNSDHVNELNEKDEKEISKDLENMMNDLDSKSGYSKYNDGEPMTDEDRQLLKISLENSLRLAKQLAKKKFTPKKYR